VLGEDTAHDFGRLASNADGFAALGLLVDALAVQLGLVSAPGLGRLDDGDLLIVPVHPLFHL
jgi:hypothetical protein